MKRSIHHITFSFVVLALLLSSAAAQHRVDRYVFGLGGTEMKSANNHIIGTLGQTLIGVAKNTAHTNNIGFWYSVESVPVGITPETATAVDMQLGQSYPNPAADMTVIPFTLAKGGTVRLTVMNVLGMEIRSVVDGFMEPGSYRVQIDARNLPGGYYFYRLEQGSRTITKSLLVR
ncbi:MAG: T9SS type A sorting domain-containing protein [Bacteroidetes bacterium]|nr:T9SS type A sorting domain-containing protein [Bacteroidota bacterium]